MEPFEHEPGSPAAIAQGCTCPPQTGPERICDANCPIHASEDWVEANPPGAIDPDDYPVV